jgi:hypothetical protein
MRDYILRIGRHSLRLGARVDLPLPAAAARQARDGWDLPEQDLTARAIVEELDSLFEAVCQQLGTAADRGVLMQSMAATLATGGREAALPLATLDFADPLRRELADQAADIGAALAAWAVEANDSRVALHRHGAASLERLELRSHCDGHLWTEQATAVLTGAAGGPGVMQLYNEWLHQLVLLRDALLPFRNWAELPLPLGRRGAARGLRGLEAARSSFLAEFLTRILSHGAIVRFAHSIFAGTGVADPVVLPDYYGFQAERGAVLPSVIGAADVASGPKGLLSWHPARIAEVPQPGGTLLFHYALADYLAAPRSLLDATATAPAPSGDARVSFERAGDRGLVLWLALDAGDRVYRVDLGQSLRGQRYAYRPAAGRGGVPANVLKHGAQDILSRSGLVTAEGGIHLLPTDGNAILTLALLGKIYPENTVLGEAAPWGTVLSAGKGYGAKFVLGVPQ